MRMPSIPPLTAAGLLIVTAASEMNVTYDWKKGAWTNLPLGIKVSKLHKFDTLPVQFSGSYEYNVANTYVAPEWTLNLTVKFLFPI